MNVLQIFQSFQTQEQAVEYLERIRWSGRTICTYCKSDKVCRHASGDRARMRWQCWGCERTFAVTVGTIFHGTHIPLKNWFLLLALMLNTKESASASQISRDLGIRRPTVWRMMHRVRLAIAKDQEQAKLLYGIVEGDETYIAGKPRKGNRHDGKNPKGGHGTKKIPVIGVLDRGGRVIASKPHKLETKGLFKLVTRCVHKSGLPLIAHEWRMVFNVMLNAVKTHDVQACVTSVRTFSMMVAA